MADPHVLGYRIEPLDLHAAADRVLALAAGDSPSLVVTLNPEIVVQAEDDPRLKGAIHGADLVVADGVGVVWAARRAGYRLAGRVPGVELAQEVLRRGGPELRVYLLGARPGVAERAGAAATAAHGIHVVGTHHGYFARPDGVPSVIAAIRDARPHILLAGLGEGQERFLAEHLQELGVPVSIGVGGTLDVLAGEARRTPAWTRNIGAEWAWRVGLDPKRWHRIPRLMRFARMVLASGGDVPDPPEDRS